MYNLLFAAAAAPLLEVAADPKHLGARIGFISILHTWGQNLQHHEVDPIVWTKFRRFLSGGAGGPGGGPKAAIHSGLESALGSHPCVALSSYQAFSL